MPTRDRSSLYVKVQTKEQVLRFAQERGMTIDQALQELLKNYSGNGGGRVHEGPQQEGARAPAEHDGGNGGQVATPPSPVPQPTPASTPAAAVQVDQRRAALWAFAISAAAVATLWALLFAILR
ncbi:MAG: hypothetical protein C4339_03095 [Nitrososphaerota archaeon]